MTEIEAILGAPEQVNIRRCIEDDLNFEFISAACAPEHSGFGGPFFAAFNGLLSGRTRTACGHCNP